VTVAKKGTCMNRPRPSKSRMPPDWLLRQTLGIQRRPSQRLQLLRVLRRYYEEHMVRANGGLSPGHKSWLRCGCTACDLTAGFLERWWPRE
jgi:hypothetical protein